VLEVAQDLLGCAVEHDRAAGLIVETEAYHHSEPACHAYVGLTVRTSTLFGEPGRAYVYRSYGIHALLNAVCEPEGTGAAVLIRALQPLSGIELMRRRRGPPGLAASSRARAPETMLCSGPGKLTQALGIKLEHNGSDLATGPVVFRERSSGWGKPAVLAGPRVGISKGVDLDWRFAVAGSPYVSRRPAT
jgi:DNA-3-methyladenine glycosylase